MKYDFAKDEHYLGPWRIRAEWLYRLHGWWPPERLRREVARSYSQGWNDGYERGRTGADGYRDGWEACRQRFKEEFAKLGARAE